MKKDDFKLPPHSTDAEQAVLGGIMLDNACWEKVAGVLVAEDFYLKSHRILFAKMSRMFDKGEPVDLLTLSERLEAEDKIEACGGFAYLAELSKNIPSTANIMHYASLIRERAVIREMITAGNDIVSSGFTPEGRSSEELLDLAENQIFQIAERRAGAGKGPQKISATLNSTLSRLEELYQSPGNGITGIDTGFVDLNVTTAGLQPSDLIIIAGRPSMGKTTFGLNICENVAMLNEKPVLIFSLEMPAEQLMTKIMSSLSRVEQNRLRTGQLDDEDWARLTSTVGMLIDKENIYIDDSSMLTPGELRARARRLHREQGGLSLIMVDYLQLMRAPVFADNRTLEIAEISRSLKALAKELKVPVVALSQLNRSLEQRADKRPLNSDLRESGSIEQDADLIMFVYRDEVYDEHSAMKGIAEIIIGKQRNGPTGTIRLTFNGKFSRFDNYTGAVQEF